MTPPAVPVNSTGPGNNLRLQQTTLTVQGCAMESEGGELVCPHLAPAVKAKLQEQLQSMDLAFTIADCSLPDMPIMFASSRFYDMTGYTIADVLGKNCRFLQGKGTEKRKIMEIRDAIREERSCQVCLLNYRKDGTPFWNQFYLAPIRDDTGLVTHYLGIQQDVTSQLAAAPRPSLAQQLSGTCRRSSFQGSEQQLEGGGAPGQQTPDTSSTAADRADEADASTCTSAALALQQQGQQLDARFCGLGAGDRSDGNGVVVQQAESETSEEEEVADVVVEEAAAAERLCEMVAAARAGLPRLLPASLRQSLLKVAQCFVLSDPRLPDCPIVHVSQRFLDMTGYSREEVVGRNCRFLQGPATDPAEVARLSAAIHAKPPQPITVTLLNFTKTGRPFWNCLHVAPIRDADGAVEYFIGVQLDATEEEQGAAAAAGGIPGPQPYRLAHRMAHMGATGAVRVACRSLSGGQGGLRRSMECQGLPRKGNSGTPRKAASADGGSSGDLQGLGRHGSGPAAVECQREQQLAGQQEQQGSQQGYGVGGGGSRDAAAAAVLLGQHPRHTSSPAALH